MNVSETIDRFRSPLVGLIVSWGVPAADAADIAQDSFVQAYFSEGQCRGDTDDPVVMGRWLRGIARNKFRTWRRARGRRSKYTVSTDPAILEQTATEKQGDDVDTRITALRRCIDRLPTKQRQVILMHYLDETTVADVAAVLSITPKSVEGRLYQARRTLRRMMDASSSASSSSVTQITKALLL